MAPRIPNSPAARAPPELLAAAVAVAAAVPVALTVAFVALVDDAPEAAAEVACAVAAAVAPPLAATPASRLKDGPQAARKPLRTFILASKHTHVACSAETLKFSNCAAERVASAFRPSGPNSLQEVVTGKRSVRAEVHSADRAGVWVVMLCCSL
ncbi:hypothetical protein BJ741DRAFT_590478 [Chytriomyces cf. hyalinus JEL632]|nr:hypothetical protein BJ741DRAFT_590478 [Chytriomyces cf. hyalinus JEL632]